MNSLSSRLGKVTAGLTGKERATMMLRALEAGDEPDPKLRIIDDPAEALVYDRCMTYIYTANAELNSITYNLLYQADWLENFSIVDVLRESGEMTGEPVDPRKVKNWRKAKDINVGEFLFGLAEEARGMILEVVLDLAKEMSALELVRKELSEEFGGVDLTLPEVRALTQQVEEKLAGLLATYKAPKVVPAPDEDRIDAMRARVEHVFRNWRLMEIRPERKKQAWESEAGTPLEPR